MDSRDLPTARVLPSGVYDVRIIQYEEVLCPSIAPYEMCRWTVHIEPHDPISFIRRGLDIPRGDFEFLTNRWFVPGSSLHELLLHALYPPPLAIIIGKDMVGKAFVTYIGKGCDGNTGEDFNSLFQRNTIPLLPVGRECSPDRVGGVPEHAPWGEIFTN